MLAVLRLGVLSYWMNSYWGGAAAALGGALVMGALPRVQRARTGASLLLAVGAAVLANSRPYEGLFFIAPVAILLVGWSLGAESLCRWFGLRTVRPPLRVMALRIFLPVTAVLVFVAILMGHYFWRVTGDPLTMPRVIEARQYSITPLFIWQKLRPAPAYDDDRLRYFYTQWEPNESSEAKRAFAYWAFYLGPSLTLPLAMVWVLVGDRKMRFFVALCSSCAVGLAIEWWDLPHYAAPITVPLYAILLQGIRHVSAKLHRTSRHSRWRGVPALVPVTVVIMLAVSLSLRLFSIPLNPSWPPAWAGPVISSTPRSMLEGYLRKQGGKHLVLVRYVNHNYDPAIHSEWVFNAADIDNSPIVWARELDEDHNRQLREYYRDRRVWLCSPDERVFVPVR